MLKRVRGEGDGVFERLTARDSRDGLIEGFTGFLIA